MSKKILSLSMLLFALAFLVACGGSRELNERQLIEILQEDADNSARGMTVTSLTIERRQTEDRTDRVYAIVESNNGDVAQTAFLTLGLTYYDVGGWILSNLNSRQNPIFSPLSPPTQEQAINQLSWSDSSRFNDYDRISLVSTDISDYRNGRASFTFEYTNDRLFLTSSGTVILNSIFSESRGVWETSIMPTVTFGSSGNYWKFENMLGSWQRENNRSEDAPTGFLAPPAVFDNFWINISEISGDSAVASGRASMQRGGSFGIEGHFSEEFNGAFSVSEIGQTLRITVLSLSYVHNPALTFGGAETRYRTYTIIFDADRAFVQMDAAYLNHGQGVEFTLVRSDWMPQAAAVAPSNDNAHTLQHEPTNYLNYFVGIWDCQMIGNAYHFYSDGTGIAHHAGGSSEITWTASENLLTIFYTIYDSEWHWVYRIENGEVFIGINDGIEDARLIRRSD